MKRSLFYIVISPLNLKLTRDPETFSLYEVIGWLQDSMAVVRGVTPSLTQHSGETDSTVVGRMVPGVETSDLHQWADNVKTPCSSLRR